MPDIGTLTPEQMLQQQQILRNQKMSEMLMQQGMEQPKSQMVSGHYVAPSIFQNLAGLANTYVGQRGLEKADQAQLDLAKAIREQKMGVLENINQALDAGDLKKARGIATSNPEYAGQFAAPLIANAIPKPTELQQNYQSWVDAGNKGSIVDYQRQIANAIPKPTELQQNYQSWVDAGNKGSIVDYQRQIANLKVEHPSFTPVEGTSYAMNSRTGQIVTLKDPVTGQPLAPKAPPHIQNELTAINQQKSVINGVIKNVETNPNAFGARQGFVEGLPMGGVVQNRKMTPEQVQARANVFNASSAVIKERAGTAQSEGERVTIMKFLPSPLDSSDVIINKMIGFNKYLEDKEKGTTAVLGGVKSYIPNATNSNLSANPAVTPSASKVDPALLQYMTPEQRKLFGG
jgi:hypothetical protein